MEIEKAKLSSYTQIGNEYGEWELDIYLKGEDERRIVNVDGKSLMEASGSKRKGLFRKSQKFLNGHEGLDWLYTYLNWNGYFKNGKGNEND